ncbi:hypothetical protein [Riemerella columbipharyngis]|uniref:hypothetical protein n=1 Tax=Riemerella columbipharyngis TaxID=1071918 RepID=UPI0011600717|nr:hypothetical protein [Riemerella columbipharyngis]
MDIWSKEHFDVKGDIVVGIPARDVLLVTGSEDTENLVKMRKIAADIFETGAHIITDSLFVFRSGIFQILE